MKLELLPGPKLMLIVLDGLGDRKIKELGWKTPLEAAFKPNLDYFAKFGLNGRHYPLEPGLPVGSGVAHTMLFGYSLKDYPERGPIEALGIGAELEHGDLAFRINFATFAEDGKVVLDRRAGRADFGLDEIARDLSSVLSENPFGLEIEVYHSTQHRGVLVVREWKRAFGVRDTDPQVEGREVVLPEGNREIDELVRWIHRKSFEFLENHEINKRRKELGLKPANGILLRGAGMLKDVEKFTEKYGLRGAGIASDALYLGIARYFGLDPVLKLEDEEKITKALELLKNNDFVFVHFKKTDNASHDGDFLRKKEEIEKVDRLLEPLKESSNLAVLITGDHATPCSLRTHSGDAVPFLIWGENVPRDNVEKFGEGFAVFGEAGTVEAKYLMQILLNASGRLSEFGK